MCVVALVSTGKSTLINALLGEKLMPSSQQACTATITKIKDKDQPEWRYTAYEENEDGTLRQRGTPNALLNFKEMKNLNSDSKVVEVDITGNIPFVSSKETSLVITDTPGSNNAQNRRHGEVQERYLNKNSKSLVLYLTRPDSFETDSDDALLKRVAENMKSAGKQARDRFIFVLNRMDDIKDEDGDVSKTLAHAREFFKRHGIENPKLFPVSALSALNIRLAQKGVINKEHIKATMSQVDKLMLNGYSFEQYAPLPEGVKEEISEKLEKARQEAQSADEESLETEAMKIYGNDRRTVWDYVELKKNGEEALIHSGIVSIEEAIRQYLEKYARPAKIYDFVQVFDKHFQALKYKTNLEQELLSNQENCERILRQMELADKNLNNMTSAKQFENKMESTVKKIKSDAQQTLNTYAKTYESEISKKTMTYRTQKLSKAEAMELLEKLQKFVSGLLQEYETALYKLMQETLCKTCESLINEYKEKLSSVAEEIDSSLESVSFNPLTLMSASIPEINIEKMVKEEDVKTGEEWQPYIKWYNPLSWINGMISGIFGIKIVGHYEDIIQKVQYIKGDKLCQDFFTPIQKGMLENRIAVLNYIIQESDRVTEAFKQEFKILDKKLNEKMKSLKQFASERDEAKARLIETQKKLEWIQYIETRINQILEI